MSFVETVAKNIRKYKTLQKTSYLKIATKAGIPYTTFENILYSRIADIKGSTLLKIARALRVGLDDLVK